MVISLYYRVFHLLFDLITKMSYLSLHPNSLPLFPGPIFSTSHSPSLCFYPIKTPALPSVLDVDP